MEKGGAVAPPESGLKCLPALLASAAATAAAVTAATAAAIFLRPGFIHVQCPAVQVAAIEPGNGLVGLRMIAHFHESKASGPPGFAIGYKVDTVNRAIRFKQGANGIFRGPEAEISNEYIFHLSIFLEFADQRIEGRIDGCRTIHEA